MKDDHDRQGELLARQFHEAYERLAPQFGYETRPETREFDPNSPNGKLMIAVCSEIAAHTAQAEVAAREIFVPVRGAEGLYEVSNTGKVRSLPGGRRSGKELKQMTLKNRYIRVSLVIGGIAKSYSVHRIVAKAFLSNPENKKCVNHIDGNPSNNDVSNLEWATYAENEQHSFNVLGKKTWNRGLREPYCKKGHLFTDANTKINPRTGGRSCRTCSNERQQEWRAARKLQAKQGGKTE